MKTGTLITFLIVASLFIALGLITVRTASIKVVSTQRNTAVIVDTWNGNVYYVLPGKMVRTGNVR